VLAQRLNVRAGPGTTYPVVGRLAANDPVDIIGQVQPLNWYQVRGLDGREGWITGDAHLVQAHGTLDNVPPAHFRPLTGVVQTPAVTGLGELHIDNPGGTDGLVVLAREGQSVVAVYVRAGDQSIVGGIPDGAYTVSTSTGNKWDGSEFAEVLGRKRWAEPIIFRTTSTEYTVWEMTIDVETLPVADAPEARTEVLAEVP